MGAVDGTFFHIRAPREWPNAYWCYKQFYSILVLAVCDANLLFTFVDAGEAGAAGDAHVWNKCLFKRALLAGVMDRVPACTTSNGTVVHSYVVGDGAFALDGRVMKCYTVPIGMQQEAFNAAVIRTRRVIENAFGHLKMRWHIFDNNTINNPNRAKVVALICCALHNWCERRAQELPLGPPVAQTVSAEVAAHQAVANARFHSATVTPGLPAGKQHCKAMRKALTQHIAARMAEMQRRPRPKP